MNKRSVGFKGEDLAVEYLEEQGITILETNYFTKVGEIDIIARDGDTTVFIEVKYRKDLKMGRPYEAVNYPKQSRIMRTAMLYAQKNNLHNKPLRFDVIEIVENQVTWIKNAFQMSNNHRYF